MTFDEWYDGQWPGGNERLARAAWKAAQEAAKPQWTPVDERLPTKDDADDVGEVFVWKQGNDFYVHCNFRRITKFGYTHWMTPPTLPKVSRIVIPKPENQS